MPGKDLFMFQNQLITDAQPNEIINKNTDSGYLDATGELKLGFTNDYIFRIVFQENLYALKGLLCSILRLNEADIVSLEIKNPIKPGTTAHEKKFEMDILIKMNSGITIDLEMQRCNENNWPERSLAYLCRDFDNLARGADYASAGYTYQIGFLDFDLFKDHPEFRSLYQVRNAVDNYLYSSKFNLIVVSLNQTKFAAQEDIDSGLVEWVNLFKAKTWEEIKMIAANNEYMQSAAESVLNAENDYYIARAAIDREAFLRRQARQEAELKEVKGQIKEIKKQVAELTEQNTELTEQNTELIGKNTELTREKAEWSIEKEDMTVKLARYEQLLVKNKISLE